jgi:hypothetical protein
MWFWNSHKTSIVDAIKRRRKGMARVIPSPCTSAAGTPTSSQSLAFLVFQAQLCELFVPDTA